MYKYKGNKQQHVFLTQTRSQLIFLHVLPPSCMIVWHGFHVCMASTVMPSEIFINTKPVWPVTQCPHDLAWIKIQFNTLPTPSSYVMTLCSVTVCKQGATLHQSSLQGHITQSVLPQQFCWVSCPLANNTETFSAVCFIKGGHILIISTR